MGYVVTEKCIKCKYMDCIQDCPVDCFYEGANMLVINPDECIDCSACEVTCPISAIGADTTPGIERWARVNAQYALVWPRITAGKMPPADARKYEDIENKFDLFFSPEPGDGD